MNGFLSGSQGTSIAEPSAVFGTTMKRRESGGTLSGSGGTFRSPDPLRPLLLPFFRLQGIESKSRAFFRVLVLRVDH